ncbi:MAG: nitroreductase family protein [Desulfotalea sp.]
MDLFSVVHTRRSIRSFNDTEVNDQDVEKILRAAMAAPSAGNQQPWHYIVVKDRAKLEAVTKIHPYAKMIMQAPLSIVVCGDLKGKWPNFWSQDCSAACQNILLSARALGLATTWTGIYPEQERMEGFREIFDIPEDIMPFAIIPVGYSDTNWKEIDRFQKEKVFTDGWGK